MVKEQEALSILCEASQANSLQELVDTGYRLTGNPIFIEDRSYILLASSNYKDAEERPWEDYGGQEKVNAPRSKEISDMRSVYDGAKTNNLPVIVNDGHLPYPRMIRPLMHKNTHIGTMVMPAVCRPFEENDVESLEILSALALSIVRGKDHIISSQHDAVDKFIISFLMENRLPENDVKEKVQFAHWYAKTLHYVMVLCPNEEEDCPVVPIRKVLEGVRHQHNCHALIFDSRVVCICHLDQALMRPEKTFPFLTDFLEENNIIVGISQSFSEPNMLGYYYQQAKSSAEVGSVLKSEKTYYPYNQFSSYMIFDKVRPMKDLRQFCHEKILKLDAYDTIHNTDLLTTLQVYLESRCSISMTAKNLFIHRNTVTYRINRCFEILESNLESKDEYFSSIMSLRILEYMKKKSRIRS